MAVFAITNAVLLESNNATSVTLGFPETYVGFCDVANLPDGRFTKKFISSILLSLVNLTEPANGCSLPNCVVTPEYDCPVCPDKVKVEAAV